MRAAAAFSCSSAAVEWRSGGLSGYCGGGGAEPPKDVLTRPCCASSRCAADARFGGGADELSSPMRPAAKAAAASLGGM